MLGNSLYRWSLALALSGALLASPAAAQEKVKVKERERPELVRRGDPRPAQPASREDGHASYEQAHERFHRRHDRECRIRASGRSLDMQWQLRVRQECRESHDAWHARAGRPHH